MPTYNTAISRTVGTDPLVPEPFVAEVIQEAAKSSAVLAQCRKVTMSTKTTRQPVLSVLPQAYWVAGDTGLKQTTSTEWENCELVAEEMATIVMVPEAYIADSGVPIWSEVRPLIGQAFATLLDQACIFGVNAPATFGDSIYEAAAAVGNSVAAGTGDDLGVDVTSIGELLADQGFALNGFMSKPGLTWRLRGLRSTNGEPIYQSDLQGAGGGGALYGMPLNEVLNGAWSSADAVLIGGDFSKAIVGVRQDMTFKVFTEGVISDAQGAVVANLMQQDSVALRVTGRFGFTTANPVTAVESSELERSPFAILTPGT